MGARSTRKARVALARGARAGVSYTPRVIAQRFKELFDAGYPCIRLVTLEETRVRRLLLDAAADFGLETWVWSSVQGLVHYGMTALTPVANTENAAAAFVWLRQNLSTPAMVLSLDLADSFDDARAVRAARELIEYFRAGPDAGDATGRKLLVMLDHKESVPATIGFLSARCEIPPPDDPEIEEIARGVISKQKRRGPVKALLSSGDLCSLIENLRGLSRSQVEQLLTDAIVEDRELSAADIPGIIKGKRQILQDAGVLEFVDAPASIDDIGGLNRLKAWLEERRLSFAADAKAFGITPPRGVLLLGVQGAGKSLAARAVAAAWKRPLMRLDPSSLYDRYIGESETRLRDALRQAEAMAPVVLWIDEIEKGFAGAAGQSIDGGLSRRMFGTLLTWMQEHTAPVFLIATANDIESLPPELLRKGRFDEIFFVDLPVAAAREQIFKIHLRKRNQDPAGFDPKALVAASDGYSGAEIEQAILSGLHWAFSTKQKLDTRRLVKCLEDSPPLSVTMAERVAELREWAKGRCVPAD